MIKNVAGLRYFLYSGLVGIIILITMYYLTSSTYDRLSQVIDNLIPIKFDFLSKVTDVLSIGAISILFFMIYKHLVLIFTAPLMSKLSEKIENYITQGNHISETSFISEILRGIRIAIRNIVREIALTIVIIIFSLFPLFGVLSSPLIFLVQGYYAGFGNYDFWAERHFTYKGTVDFMKDHKGMVTANGLFFILLLAIPILGAIIAPPLATAAGTMHAIEKMEEGEFEA